MSRSRLNSSIIRIHRTRILPSYLRLSTLMHDVISITSIISKLSSLLNTSIIIPILSEVSSRRVSSSG